MLSVLVNIEEMFMINRCLMVVKFMEYIGGYQYCKGVESEKSDYFKILSQFQITLNNIMLC